MSTQWRGMCKRLLMLPLLHTLRPCEFFSGCSWHPRCIIIHSLCFGVNDPSDVHPFNAMTFCAQGVCSKTPNWCLRTFQPSLVPASLSWEMPTFLWGTQCIRSHAGELCCLVNSLIHSIVSSHEIILTLRDMLPMLL